MRIGVIGGGVVGRATARAFIEHVDEVRVYDLMKERATHDLVQVLSTDLIFVCLPTPQMKDSLACNVNPIEDFFHHVQTGVLGTLPEGGWCSRNFVLRSTVPIGTTKRLSEQYKLPNLVHSPEFLTARCAVTDAHLPSRNIVGVPGLLSYGRDRDHLAGDTLGDLYEKRFPGVPCFLMSSNESEAVKLFLNGFFATKVAYWNEVNALVRKLGLDWDRIMEGVLSDGRVSHSHTKVPGPDGKYGFGPDTSSACLPKDLANLVHTLNNNGCLSSVTEGAIKRNLADRKRHESPGL